MIQLFVVMKIFLATFACGTVIQALCFYLTMSKPRDYRYHGYMLYCFVMFCSALLGWFLVNLAKAIYLEMLARAI